MMELTTTHLQQLRKIRELRDESPAVARYFRSRWQFYLLLAMVGGIGVGFFMWGGWPGASGLFAGLVSATILRDFGWYRNIVRTWPLTYEITDWDRVDELLGKTRGSEI